MIDCLNFDDMGYFLSLMDPTYWKVYMDPWRVDIQTLSNGLISWKYDYLKSMFCYTGV